MWGRGRFGRGGRGNGLGSLGIAAMTSKARRQMFVRKLGSKREGSGERTPADGCLLVACLTSQQYANVSEGRICSDKCTSCHTEIKVADQTFHLTQLKYTDAWTSSPSTDPLTPGARQGSHWSANL